ncbi:MAG: hypothetical protein IT337_05430 [Thermomicrobiales bacterium]|nr:hypothetical protein [Thermomicrobiales bacterium]
MGASGLSLLTIAGRQWSDKRELRVASVSASWPASNAGRLSAMLSAREAWLLGIDDYLGTYVRFDHPTMGPWAGKIEATNINIDGASIELVCESMAGAMKKRRTKKAQRQASAPAGSHVLRAFADLAVNDLPYDDIQADTDGDPIARTWNADDLFNVVTGLARESEHAFDVTIDDDWLVAFAFRRQLGEDKTGDVVLAEGYQIAGGSIVPTVANLVNDLLVASGEVNWRDATTTAVVNPASAQTYGLRQGTARYDGFSSPQALATRARIDLQRRGVPTIPVSFKLSDREPLLAEIRTGDIIRVWSASANAMYLVSVTGRSVDAESGVATLVGNAEIET